jgi:muramidase (phage lysozyme)
MADNLSAFLQMIGISELGADLIAVSDRGYNVIVGSTAEHPILFNSYADHPRVYSPSFNSTAAGKFQILERYYDAYKTQLNLPDFSPDSQDAIATQMISECGALNDISAGDIQAAIGKCGSRWASLPSSTYGQHINTYDTLIQAYKDAGGLLSSAGTSQS